MTDERMSRRRILRALGAGASAIPFLPLLEAHAEVGSPRRIVFFFSGNGTIHESWEPKVVSGKLVLSPILKPLEPFKSKISVLDGLDHTVILEKGDRNGHSAGMNTALVGHKSKGVDPANPLVSLGTGISLDQYLGQRIGAETKLRTIECGIQVLPYSLDNSALSYRGPLQPIICENSPYRVFDRLFRGFTEPSAAEDPKETEALEDRQAVLDAVSLNLESVKRRLSQADRLKMDAHLGAVRSLAHSLKTGRGAGASSTCSKPSLGRRLDVWRNDDIPALGRLQMDLLVMALACDLTRIGTVQFGRAGAAHRFNWLGPEFAVDPTLSMFDSAKGFHALAHKEADPASRAKLVKIHTWYAEQFAYLLGKLASVPEGNGTMLDNTIVLWLNELGTGSHTHERVPFVLAGNVGGLFKMGGQHVTYKSQPHNRLLLTLLNAMGVADKTFGDPDYCKGGPLGEVLV